MKDNELTAEDELRMTRAIEALTDSQVKEIENKVMELEKMSWNEERKAQRRKKLALVDPAWVEAQAQAKNDLMEELHRVWRKSQSPSGKRFVASLANYLEKNRWLTEKQLEVLESIRLESDNE